MLSFRFEQAFVGSSASQLWDNLEARFGPKSSPLTLLVTFSLPGFNAHFEARGASPHADNLEARYVGHPGSIFLDTWKQVSDPKRAWALSEWDPHPHSQRTLVFPGYLQGTKHRLRARGNDGHV